MKTQFCSTVMLATAVFGSTAMAQLLPPIGQLPGQVVGGVLGSNSPLGQAAQSGGRVVDSLGTERLTEGLDAPSLLELRRNRLRSLVRDHRSDVDVDDDGNPVRRDEIIAIAPSASLIDAANTAGFSVLRDTVNTDLGLRTIVLAPPRGRSAAKGAKQLRTLDPASQIALNHVFEPAGMALMAGGSVAAARSGAGALIGMIDGGVAAHPALASARIEQRAFTPRGVRGSGHGTAVASLIVGNAEPFSGAASGASLLAADVYGGDPTAGTSETIVRALGWLASRHPRVITISLVGPPNLLLERAIKIVQARGILVVAAVGNDGPAAPPQYPASYPDVIAVTAVDGHDRALFEAGKALHLDFAAPGADMAAALPGKGYARVRGTSFAAPLVAARLAQSGNLDQLAAEASPGKGRVGRGIICRTCRILPQSVAVR